MRAEQRGALEEQDQRARRSAQLEFVRPLALEAGAGTGKTTTLVARILAWSLDQGWQRAEQRLRDLPQQARSDEERIAADVLSRIVAITFTEAAAAEMSTRVAATLSSLARGDQPGWLLQEAVPAPQVMRRRARALAATLDHFSARTIHAYCRSLLSQHALEAGLHPRLTVDAEGEESDEIVRQAVEEKLQEAYGQASDSLYLQLAAEGVGPLELGQSLSALVLGGATPAMLSTPVHRASSWQGLAQRLHRLLEALSTSAAPLEGLPAQHRGGRGVLSATWRSLSAVQPLLRSSSVSTNRPTANAEPVIEEPANREPAPSEILRQLRALWQGPIDRLAKWARAEFTQTESRLLGPRRTPRVRQLCADLYPILQHTLELRPERLELRRRALLPLLRQVRSEMRRRGLLTFDDLLVQVDRLLDADSEVVQEIRSHVDQFLVDEFQDTDSLQGRIIERLALEQSGPDEPPGLFVVGDPKQSIFGWRSADLRAYHSLLGRLRQLGGEVHTLSENFRSTPAILEHVERVVAPVMMETPGLQPKFVPLFATENHPLERATESASTDFNGPSLEHWISWTNDGPATHVGKAAELEAHALSRDLSRLQRAGVPWSRIGVLFRSLNDIAPYLEALRRADIPFTVARDPQYYQRREIIELTAMIRLVLDPMDQVALLTALRSVYIGVPDTALSPLWQAGLPAHFATLGSSATDLDAWLDRTVANWTGSRSIPDLAELDQWPVALGAAARHASELRRSFRSEPAEVFVERLRHRFFQQPLESARYLGATRLDNLDRLLGRFRDWLEEGLDTTVLLRQLRHRLAPRDDRNHDQPRESGQDAVRLSTIHRAKGLDFRHVYVMQLHKKTSDRPRVSTEVAAVRGENALETQFGMHEYRLLGLASPGFDLVWQQRREVAEAELVRLLYVALTRAELRLVLAGIWPDAGMWPDNEAGAPNKPATSIDSLAELLVASGKRASGQKGASVQKMTKAGLDPPSISRLLSACEQSGQPFVDLGDTRWLFPALAPAAEPKPRPHSRRLDVREAERQASKLSRARGGAVRRMQQSRRAAASEEAHAELVEQLVAERALPLQGDDLQVDSLDPEYAVPDALGSAAPVAVTSAAVTSAAVTSAEEATSLQARQLAQAVGTAVHQALETLDLRLDPESAIEEQLLLLPARLRDLLPGTQRAAALQRSRRLLTALRDSLLLRYLWQIRDGVRGRELPVWLQSDEIPADSETDGQDGHDTTTSSLTGGVEGEVPRIVVGTIDLLYTDPEDGSLVIADFKTDELHDEHALEQRVEAYRLQGEVYQRALATALQLERIPSFELWFLSQDRRVRLGPQPV